MTDQALGFETAEDVFALAAGVLEDLGWMARLWAIDCGIEDDWDLLLASAHRLGLPTVGLHVRTDPASIRPAGIGVCEIIDAIQALAHRYADGRRSHAAAIVNSATRKIVSAGVPLSSEAVDPTL